MSLQKKYFAKSLRPLHFLGFLVCFLIISTCSDDDTTSDCSDEVWGMSATCTPDCVYYIDYGPDETNLTTIEVNRSTYEYYKVIVEDAIEQDCWEGVKD